MINDSMTAKGWLTSNPGARADVTILTEQINPLTEIKPNKIGISSEDLTNREMELGSNLAENRWDIFIDIFAENEFVGVALAGDLFDIIRGKMPSIGRDDSNFPIYDYIDDSLMFYCELENAEVNRVRDWERPYNKYWWVVACQIVDTYYDDQVEEIDVGDLDGGDSDGPQTGDIDGGSA